MKKSKKASNRIKRQKKTLNCSKAQRKKHTKARRIIVLPEYYQSVFREIHKNHENQIYKKYINDSQAFRRNAVCNHSVLTSGADAALKYDSLKSILVVIEEEMKSVIEKHSVFFWLHLYRRIAPSLGSDLGVNTDPTVAVNVRQQLEQAFKKYGVISEFNDYALSSEINPESILGGLFSQSLKKSRKPKQIKFFEEQLKNNSQWVLTDFNANDIINTYYLEGLSYQYWYISAKMRASGKGVLLSISDKGDIDEKWTEEQLFLISNFDKRNLADSIKLGLVSNVGSYTISKLTEAQNWHESIVITYINAGFETAKNLGLDDLTDDFCPNYLPFIVNSTAFFKSHSYLSKKFETKFNFGLLEFLQFSGLLSNYTMYDNLNSKMINKHVGLTYYTKFQRGYRTINSSLTEIKDSILNYYNELRESESIQESRLESHIDLILEYVTLNKVKQKNIGVWSRGPQYILFALKEGFLLDLSSWHFLLQNMFFGLKNYDPKSIKGHEFEAVCADLLKSKGFDVIKESTTITCGSSTREIDVAVRIENNLYLLECKAAERPLDFEIGNPKTIIWRNRDFMKKLEQAETLREFILKSKCGNNYDFSWAKNINSFVVSPFTEWVWSSEPNIWSTCKRFPRIMSLNDVLQFFNSEKTKHNL